MSQRRWLRALLAVLVGGCLAVPGLARAGEKEDVAKLKQQVKALQKEVKSLRDQLDALKNTRPGFPGFPGGPGVQPGFRPGGPGGFTFPPGFLKGKVKKVDAGDKTKVTIELNDKVELKAGQMVMVMRKGPPPQMVGRLKITDVSGKEATGKLEGAGKVQAGDDVIAPPGGFPGGGGFPGPGVFPPPKGGFPGFGKAVEGKVSKFDKDKGVVTLSVGADSGLKVGQMVMAMKKGAQPRPVGMIRITAVKGKEVVGELTKSPFAANAANLQVDEELRLMPTPQGFPGGPGGPRGIAPPPPPPPPK